MKSKIIAIVAVFLCVIVEKTDAQGMKFFHGNFEELKAEAKKQNKHIFLDFYTKWCGPCKMMAKEVFPLREVGEFYNKYFICCKIDAEVGEGIQLAKKYKVQFYPTFTYLDCSGNVIFTGGSIKGGDPASFIRMGKKALGLEVVNLQWYVNEYEKGNRETKFLLDYQRLSAIENKVLPEGFRWTIFESFSEEEKKSCKGQRYIVGNASPGNKFYNYWINNKEQISIYDDELDYIERFSMILSRNSEQENYKEICKQLEKDFPAYADLAIEYTRIDQLRFEEDVEEYLKEIYRFMCKNKLKDSRIITNIEEAIMEQEYPKAKYVKLVLEEAEKNLQNNSNNFSAKSTYAYLLYLSGKRREAKKYAKSLLNEAKGYQNSKKIKWFYQTVIDIAKGKKPMRIEY